MKVLWVLLIILAVFWLLGRIRLGGWVQYDEDGLAAKVLAGPLKFTVFPQKPLSEAEKAKRKTKADKARVKKEAKKAKAEARRAKKEAKWRKKHPGEEPQPEKKGGALPPILDLLPLAAEAALGFGRANAVIGMIWPLLDNNFKVKKHDLGVRVDFNQTAPTIMCRAALTMRLGQLVSFGLRLLFKFLAVWSRSRKRSAEKQEA